MSANTKIEWADHTFNPWIGCTKVGPGCDHCYAEADFDKRRHVVSWGSGQPRKRTSPSTWAQPLRWNAEADRLGVRYRVFCASLADVFDNEVPLQWRQHIMTLIADTPHLDWLLLTKRIGNATRMLQDACEHDGRLMDASDRYRPMPNIWIGATITIQAEADRDIPKLLAVPAARRFLSMEPLLGPVNLMPMFEHRADAYNDTGIDWVIVGGESGPNARPMHPEWARSLRDQCAEAGVPFLFKQWGEWSPVERDEKRLSLITMPGQCRKLWAWPGGTRDGWKTGQISERVGKNAAGRLLDGVEHNGFPAPAVTS